MAKKPLKSYYSDAPMGSQHQGGTVPGTTGSDSRESAVDNFAQGERIQQEGYSLAFGNNTDNDPRANKNHGKASYNYSKPTLIP